MLKRIVIAAILTALVLTLFAGCGKQNEISLSGTVESTQIGINSEVSGKVISLEKEEGAQVKKDDVIAVLDSSIQTLAVKQQEEIVNMKQAKLDDLLDLSNVSDNTIKAARADLEQSKAALEQAKLVLSKYEIKCPSDGTLIERNVNIGDIVNTGASVGTVSDLAKLDVKLYIPQKYIQNVTLNEEINLTAAALNGVNIKGKIVFIASEAEYTPKNVETEEAKENTVFKIKVNILDNIDKLKSGMTVSTKIPTGGK